MGKWDQFDDEEEDEAFRDAMEMAESVKDGWGAREQLEACLALAEAALLSKAAKAQRREQAEEERRRVARERAMSEKREREEREAREIVAARERETLRVQREREARQSAIPVAPAGPSAEELRRQERERQVAAEERAAKVRLANAQAAEIEAKAELMRAQARAAARTASPVPAGAVERSAQLPHRPEPPALAPVDRVRRSPSERREARTALQMAVKAPVVDTRTAAPTPGESLIEAADRAALMSVGRWPPPPARPDSPFWTADADWPADWTLTGYDLAIFRGHLNVSQAVFAGQVGVPTVEIARAEARPKAKVRPALQVAVRAAMEDARKVRETRRAVEVVGTARASTVAAGPGSPLAEGSVEAPGTAAPERAGLMGADLARWRAAAGLTQRQAAVKLGVAHGTVAKAELASGKQLGKQMEEALRKQGGEADRVPEARH